LRQSIIAGKWLGFKGVKWQASNASTIISELPPVLAPARGALFAVRFR